MEMSLKKATIYSSISKYITMIAQLILTMFLARLVAPESHGVISILLVVLNFMTLFADMGLGVSVIQHPSMKKREIRELFSFTCIIGILMVVVLVVLAYPMSVVYKNDIYIILCPIISISGFFNALNVVPNALLIRDKRFDLIAIRSVLAAVIPGAISILLAYLDFGVYALIFQSVCGSVFIFVWNYIKNPLKPCKFNIKHIFSLLGNYSLFQFLFNVLNYFTRNLDNLLIGAKMSSTELGYYNKAYTLNLYPNTLFTNIFTGVLHPYLRDYKNDYDCLEEKLIKILKVLSLAGILIMTICFSCAKEIILIMFGDMWLPAVPCFRMLSICIWAQMLSGVAGSVFLGIERTDQTFKCGIINLILIVFSIITGLLFNSIEIVSLCVGIAYNLIFIITYYILIKQTFKHSIIRFYSYFFPDALYSIIIMTLGSVLLDLNANVFVGIIIKTLILLCCFFAYLVMTKQLYIVKSIFGKISK